MENPSLYDNFNNLLYKTTTNGNFVTTEIDPDIITSGSSVSYIEQDIGLVIADQAAKHFGGFRIGCDSAVGPI